LHPPPRRRQEAGEKDVRFLDQRIQDFATAIGPQIQSQAALIAAAVLDEEVEPGSARNDTGADQTAGRIATRRVLDLDDVRTPVGNPRTGTGDEEPLSHFD